VVVVMAPPPSPPPPVFVPEAAPPILKEPAPIAREISSNDGPGLTVYHSPVPASYIPDEFPAMIVLKNGWAYTVTSNWIKGRTLHFTTTQGDALQVPIGMLQHVYPQVKQASR
jgi:hypothetical protein